MNQSAFQKMDEYIINSNTFKGLAIVRPNKSREKSRQKSREKLKPARTGRNDGIQRHKHSNSMALQNKYQQHSNINPWIYSSNDQLNEQESNNIEKFQNVNININQIPVNLDVNIFNQPPKDTNDQIQFTRVKDLKAHRFHQSKSNELNRQQIMNSKSDRKLVPNRNDQIEEMNVDRFRQNDNQFISNIKSNLGILSKHQRDRSRQNKSLLHNPSLEENYYIDSYEQQTQPDFSVRLTNQLKQFKSTSSLQPVGLNNFKSARPLEEQFNLQAPAQFPATAAVGGKKSRNDEKNLNKGANTLQGQINKKMINLIASEVKLLPKVDSLEYRYNFCKSSQRENQIKLKTQIQKVKHYRNRSQRILEKYQNTVNNCEEYIIQQTQKQQNQTEQGFDENEDLRDNRVRTRNKTQIYDPYSSSILQQSDNMNRVADDQNEAFDQLQDKYDEVISDQNQISAVVNPKSRVSFKDKSNGISPPFNRKAGKNSKLDEGKSRDLMYQLGFWNKVLKDARSTKHPEIIQNVKKQIEKLVEDSKVIALNLPPSDYDFQNISMFDWKNQFYQEIQNLPNGKMNDGSVLHTALFYTQIIDYLVNPQIALKNGVIIETAIINSEHNILGQLVQRHDGLFEQIKINIMRLKEDKYQVSNYNFKQYEKASKHNIQADLESLAVYFIEQTLELENRLSKLDNANNTNFNITIADEATSQGEEDFRTIDPSGLFPFGKTQIQQHCHTHQNDVYAFSRSLINQAMELYYKFKILFQNALKDLNKQLAYNWTIRITLNQNLQEIYNSITNQLDLRQSNTPIGNLEPFTITNILQNKNGKNKLLVKHPDFRQLIPAECQCIQGIYYVEFDAKHPKLGTKFTFIEFLAGGHQVQVGHRVYLLFQRNHDKEKALIKNCQILELPKQLKKNKMNKVKLKIVSKIKIFDSYSQDSSDSDRHEPKLKSQNQNSVVRQKHKHEFVIEPPNNSESNRHDLSRIKTERIPMIQAQIKVNSISEIQDAFKWFNQNPQIQINSIKDQIQTQHQNIVILFQYEQRVYGSMELRLENQPAHYKANAMLTDLQNINTSEEFVSYILKMVTDMVDNDKLIWDTVT